MPHWCLSLRIEEFLWTIPHALNGRNKFGRTLMYMSPVTSLILTSLFVLNNSVLITFHTRQFDSEQLVADVQQARHFFSPCLSSYSLTATDSIFNVLLIAIFCLCSTTSYSIKINSLQSLALRSFSATVLVEAVVATFTVLPALRSSTLFAIACANLP